MTLPVLNNPTTPDKAKPAARVMEVGKRFKVSAAHSLPRMPVSNPCSRMHGHTYHVWVFVEGPVDRKTGMVCDFADITDKARRWIDLLDHSNLNLNIDPSTAEGVASYLWDRLAPELPGLSKIRVKEGDNNVATLRRKGATGQ